MELNVGADAEVTQRSCLLCFLLCSMPAPVPRLLSSGDLAKRALGAVIGYVVAPFRWPSLQPLLSQYVHTVDRLTPLLPSAHQPPLPTLQPLKDLKNL